MVDNSSKKLSTDAYKGVRDFYPTDMGIQNMIFGIWRTAVERYGYQEYNASVIEPADLYKAKSGEEIVNEQTYTFKDRGHREVTLRPEMTPTVARMVAGRKRDLPFPLRWYSIPNLFRYEQPQRGRLREHWQLNVDIFGVTSIQAEVEIIQIASDITHAYGLKNTDFEIRLNSRKITDYLMRDVYDFTPEQAHAISKLIDKKAKMPDQTFKQLMHDAVSDDIEKVALLPSFFTLLNSKNFEEFVSYLPDSGKQHQGMKEINEVIEALEKLGITNVRFDQTLMRGFDYYTGIVFEVFDKNPLNKRSIFGGGRYDDLLSLFGRDKVPAVGFGAGDVIARDLIETYGKFPAKFPSAQLALCVIEESALGYVNDLAQKLRDQEVNVAVDFSGKKIGDQLKSADKLGIPYVICIGQKEVDSGKMILKNLLSGEEFEVTEAQIKSKLLIE